jgi:hypothetical protein
MENDVLSAIRDRWYTWGMDFEERIQKAIQRGHRRSDARSREDRLKELSEDELKRLHGQARLQVSDHIENCIKRLPNHFPGFEYETIYGERGWGTACSRDDIRMTGGRRENDYSRLELTVRPISSYCVLELTGKATIRNKEVFNRSHFEPISDADVAEFLELVDLWILEYAELYAAQS